MEDNKKEIDVNKLFLQTYNRIANWHNEDGTGNGLKLVTHLIIDSVMDTVLESLSLKYDSKIKMSDDLREKINNIKKDDPSFLT